MIPDEDRRLRSPLFPTMPPLGMATAGPVDGPPISGPAFLFTRSPAPAPAGDGSGGGTAAETAPDFPSPQVEKSGAVAIHVSPAMAVLISSIAIHDDCTVGQLIGRLAGARAEQIGLGVLARAVADRDEAEL